MLSENVHQHEIDEEQATKIAQRLRYVGISFVGAVVSYALFLYLSPGLFVVFVALPFYIVYVVCVAWLSEITHNSIIAIITILLAMVSIGVFIIMVLSCCRAVKELKKLGYKPSFTGKLIKI